MPLTLKDVVNSRRNLPPRIILLGTEKIGKSTFGANAPAPIFIPIKGEEGIDNLSVASFPTCMTFDMVTEALNSLLTEKHDFQTVVIDSTSTLEALCQSHCCARYNTNSIEKVLGGFGKGYTEVLDEWRQIMDLCDKLRKDRSMCSILIGHVAVKQFQDPIAGLYDQYIWDIHKHASSLMFRWADSILFASTKTITVKEDAGFNKESKRALDAANGKRILYTQSKPMHPGGGRGAYGQLPYEIPFTFQDYMNAVMKVQQQS